MPETNPTSAYVQRRLDQLPTPERHEPGAVRRALDRTLAVYDPAYPARPWHIVYGGDPRRTGEWLSDQDTAAWHDLVPAGTASSAVVAPGQSALAARLEEQRLELRAERRSKGVVADKLGAARAELARARERLRELQAAAPGAAPATGHLGATSSPSRHPQEPRSPLAAGTGADGDAPAWERELLLGDGSSAHADPGIARFADGCRQVDGTWLHGRPHTCPRWMHE